MLDIKLQLSLEGYSTNTRIKRRKINSANNPKPSGEFFKKVKKILY